jgi:uncharacterized protein YcnI
MKTARHRSYRRLGTAWVLALLALALPPTAAAHVQVLPATAAPDDAVLFDVLVPNERSQATTRVELQIPAGVIPFSYQEPAGWTRTLTKNEDGSARTAIWRGRLRPDGFARFSFLASTPSQEGPVAWKAIQTYSDGDKARWIGPAGSESPAAVTTVSKSFPKQNAGGEGPAGQPAAAAPAAGEDEDEDEDSGAALWLAIGALAVSLVALALVLLRRPRGSST